MTHDLVEHTAPVQSQGSGGKEQGEGGMAVRQAGTRVCCRGAHGIL